MVLQACAALAFIPIYLFKQARLLKSICLLSVTKLDVLLWVFLFHVLWIQKQFKLTQFSSIPNFNMKQSRVQHQRLGSHVGLRGQCVCVRERDLSK